MSMGKSSLLEFNNMHVCNHLAKDFTNNQIIHKLILLMLEHPGNQVRSILSCLTLLQLFLYLWPVGVACHGDEEVRFVVRSADGHSILELCIEPSGTSHK